MCVFTARPCVVHSADLEVQMHVVNHTIWDFKPRSTGTLYPADHLPVSATFEVPLSLGKAQAVHNEVDHEMKTG